MCHINTRVRHAGCTVCTSARPFRDSRFDDLSVERAGAGARCGGSYFILQSSAHRCGGRTRALRCSLCGVTRLPPKNKQRPIVQRDGSLHGALHGHTQQRILIYTTRLGCFMCFAPPLTPRPLPAEQRGAYQARGSSLPRGRERRPQVPARRGRSHRPPPARRRACCPQWHVGLQPSALGREQQLPLAHSHAQQVLPGARTAVGTEPCEPRASGPLERACKRRRPRLVEGGDGREGAAVMREIARPLRASEMR